MTHKGPYSCSKTDVIAKNQLFSLQIAQKCKKKVKGDGPTDRQTDRPTDRQTAPTY